MFTDFDVKKAVEARYSVRSYDKRAVDKALVQKLLDYAASVQNPFGLRTRVQLIEKDSTANSEKLGTYGVIKGAKLYLGVTVEDKPYAMEALGYSFEKLVLYAASLGLGTCWLGGTFNRTAFAEAMEIKEGELFPILSPLGWPAEKKSLTEKLMRRGVKADSRADWSELFFSEDFSKAVNDDYQGEYRTALELVRLAPSAVNKQPWRLVLKNDRVDFYKKGIAMETGSIDMQRIDLGIAMCHFELGVQAADMIGHFELDMKNEVPKGIQYIASWIRD